jgi:hypothetical protein
MKGRHRRCSHSRCHLPAGSPDHEPSWKAEDEGPIHCSGLGRYHSCGRPAGPPGPRPGGVYIEGVYVGQIRSGIYGLGRSREVFVSEGDSVEISSESPSDTDWATTVGQLVLAAIPHKDRP